MLEPRLFMLQGGTWRQSPPKLCNDLWNKFSHTNLPNQAPLLQTPPPLLPPPTRLWNQNTMVDTIIHNLAIQEKQKKTIPSLINTTPPLIPTSYNVKVSHAWRTTSIIELPLQESSTLPLTREYCHIHPFRFRPQQWMHTNNSFIALTKTSEVILNATLPTLEFTTPITTSESHNDYPNIKTSSAWT